MIDDTLFVIRNALLGRSVWRYYMRRDLRSIPLTACRALWDGPIDRMDLRSGRRCVLLRRRGGGRSAFSVGKRQGAHCTERRSRTE